MTDDLHRIDDDLREVQNHPRWMWRHVAKGLRHAGLLLAAHAEFQSRYPEDTDEAHD